MFTNCPNVLLQVGFVQSFLLRLNHEILHPLSVNVYRIESRDRAVCIECAELPCGKETRINVKIQQILLISNLVFSINFQVVFHCNCVKNLI